MTVDNFAAGNTPAQPTNNRKTDGAQERAWLAGVSWLQALTQDEREAAFAAIRLPDESAGWTPDALRVRLALESAWQIEGSLDLIIGLPDLAGAKNIGILSVAIRCRDLACAVMSALDDETDDLSEVRRTVRGTYRAAQGGAS